MVSMISQGVRITVDTAYQPDYSNPFQNEYMFAYTITIENFNSFPIKLHKRHWEIFDSNGISRNVDGDGVVGIQPIISPNENYEYASGCSLRTEMGSMKGFYEMENLNSKKLFSVEIPIFELVAPFKSN